jgi:tetratricopeptide (TPR) repeat protein
MEQSANMLSGLCFSMHVRSTDTVVMTLQQDLANAFRFHQSGDLAAAARGYAAILGREPEQVDALQLLGVLRLQQGQFAEAAVLLEKAVTLRPGAASFHSNLAEAYRALGQFERAVGCCRTALHLKRDYPEAHNNLGLALRALGRFAEAAEEFRAALELRPNFALAHSNLGIALRSLGQLEPAIDQFRTALEQNPSLGTNWANLGQALLDLGRPAEALTPCRQAVVLEPGLAEGHNRFGEALRALGRFTEAIASFVEAIRLDPDLARAYANVGIALRQDGRLPESPPWFRRAAQLEPDNLAYQGYLADAVTDLDLCAEGIECYRRMIELEPTRAQFYNNLGWVLQREGHDDEAQEQYLTALRIQPDYPEALFNMGGLMEKLGDMDQAKAWFHRAIASNPADTDGLARLARLEPHKLSADVLCLIEGRIADPSLEETARVSLLFASANVLDARRCYADAAKMMRRANAAALAKDRIESLQYKPADHERLVGTMIEAFQPGLFTRFAGAGVESRRPVFIFGLPRSGTTLIEQVLASHSQLYGAGELNQGRLNFEAIPILLNRNDNPLNCLPDLSAPIVRQLADRHEARLIEIGHGSARVADKMTENYLYLGLLAILFPNATFIHCRRDLRDVAVSCYITSFRGLRWTRDPQHMASRFQQYLRLMNHWRTVLRVPIHVVDYEETVDDLESVARRLVAACGLDWEPACLEFHRTVRPVDTASLAQVRQPVYKTSIARWRNYEHELADLFSILEAATSIGSQ